MSKDKYEELREAIKGATPGPWRVGTPPPNGEQTIGTYKGLMVAVAVHGCNHPTKANADYIAAANPAAITELLADRDAAKTRIAELEQACRYEADLCEQALDSRKHAEARITGLEAALIKESARTADAVQRAVHFERRLGDANGLGNAARDGLAQAVTRIADLEKDAARYQWLKRKQESVDDWLPYIAGGEGNPDSWGLMGEEADAAIDAAMKESP